MNLRHIIHPNIFLNNEKIKSKTYKSPKDNEILYQIINYDEKYVCDNDTEIGVYRSVILAKEKGKPEEQPQGELEGKTEGKPEGKSEGKTQEQTEQQIEGKPEQQPEQQTQQQIEEPEQQTEGKLLCFTPPKSFTYEKFVESSPLENIHANELIEGTTLSLFFDERIQSWEIASKGAIGGNYWFFRNQYELDNQKKNENPQLTFRQMFLQALRQPDTANIADIAFLENLSKEHCYNFVLQHPANHIVLNIQYPLLYLVSVYQLVNQEGIERTAVFIPPTVYEKWNCFVNLRGIIEFPKTYSESTYADLKTNHCSIQSPPTSVGIMLTDLETGHRSCIENPTYKSLRELRGNHPNLHYQYLCLRRLGKDKIMEFVRFFPKYKEIFFKFYRQYGDFITNVHASYISYYIKKTGQKISKQYFPVIYRIHHEIYLPSMNGEGRMTNGEGRMTNGEGRMTTGEGRMTTGEGRMTTGEGRMTNDVNKTIIRREIVKDFIEKMNPIELIYYLNYTKIEHAE